MIGCLVLYNSTAKPQEINTLFSTVYEGCSLCFTTEKEVITQATTKDLPEALPGFFVVGHNACRETNYPISIPAKGSTAVTWFNGFIDNKKEIDDFTSFKDPSQDHEGFSPAKLLIKLNSSKHPDMYAVETNYTHLVKHRVIDKLQGMYSMTLAYLTMSSRSRIIVSAKQKDIYFYLAYTNDYYVLLWTDQIRMYEVLKAAGVMVYGMTPLNEGGTLVLHPIFLVSKWRKWRNKNLKTCGTLKAVSILEGYLSRITVRNPEGEEPT